MNAFVEITRPGRPALRHCLDGTSISVGRSEACAVSLPDVEELQPEHLRIVPNEDGCRFTVTGADSAPVLLHGRPHRSCDVRWGEDAYVGNVRFRPGIDGVRRPGRLGAPFLLAAAAVLATGGYLAVQQPGELAGPGAAPPDPPDLFDESVPCTQQATAAHRAREAEEAALSRMERFPFEPQDGVRAVHLLSEALECYAFAGLDAEGSETRGRLDAWKRRIAGDYRSRRLGLRLALQNRNGPRARQEVRALRELLAHRNGDYTEWIVRLERSLADEERDSNDGEQEP